MNINDLTIGEVKEITSLITNNNHSKSNLYDRYVGKYVICRTRNEGVNSGKVIEADETGVILEDARRLWRHRPKDSKGAWYESVAKYGITEDYSRLSTPREKLIAEDYSLTICSEVAENSLREAEDYNED